MDEHVRQQAPPLAAHGKRPVIGAEADTDLQPLLITEHRKARRQRHGDADGDIDAEDALGDWHRTGLRPHPWRSLDSLNGGIVAALRRFMLHAPLANLPA